MKNCFATLRTSFFLRFLHAAASSPDSPSGGSNSRFFLGVSPPMSSPAGSSGPAPSMRTPSASPPNSSAGMPTRQEGQKYARSIPFIADRSTDAASASQCPWIQTPHLSQHTISFSVGPYVLSQTGQKLPSS